MNLARDRVAVIIQQAVGIHAASPRGGEGATDQGRLEFSAYGVKNLSRLLGKQAIGVTCQRVDPGEVHGHAACYRVLAAAVSGPMGWG